MWSVERGNSGLIHPAMPTRTSGQSLDTSKIISALSNIIPGIQADPGGRLDVWHPDRDKFQGLYWYSKHICSMDRGQAPQWPEWVTEEGLVSVPLDYALAHEDLPVLSLKNGKPDMCESDEAWIMRPTLKEVKKIGWAEVFWRLCKSDAPVSPKILSALFHVDMDWYGSLATSPLDASWNEARRKGFAV